MSAARRASRRSGGSGAGSMIAPPRALRLLLARARRMPATTVPTAKALGRVTAQSIRAPHDLPRFASSSMDGYALRSAATRSARRGSPVSLRLDPRTRFAGSPPGRPLGDATAARIMTGAPLPEGADAVVPLEEAVVRRGCLILSRPARAGRHVRPAAEDCRRGARVVPAGTALHPGTIGLLSMLGIRRVRVRRAPRVAIVVTGSEVRRPETRAIGPYAVRDSHAAFLTAALREFAIEPTRAVFAPDAEDAVRRALGQAIASADLVVVTGGVSVGDRDLVRPALRTLGARTIFWRVSQRPGKPLYCGSRRGVMILGLPGNPASAAVCYCEYVRPALRRMLGEPDPKPEIWRARLAVAVPRDAVRTAFLRGRLLRRGTGWSVAPARRQASNLLGSFLDSDCVIVVPPGRGAVRAGGTVDVHALPWRRA